MICYPFYFIWFNSILLIYLISNIINIKIYICILVESLVYVDLMCVTHDISQYWYILLLYIYVHWNLVWIFFSVRFWLLEILFLDCNLHCSVILICWFREFSLSRFPTDIHFFSSLITSFWTFFPSCFRQLSWSLCRCCYIYFYLSHFPILFVVFLCNRLDTVFDVNKHSFDDLTLYKVSQ